VRALRNVVRLRRESRSLRREREPTLRSLGDAAYREDEPLVKALRERIREIDDELAKREEARAEVLAAARRHVDEEREAARATQRFSVVHYLKSLLPYYSAGKFSLLTFRLEPTSPAVAVLVLLLITSGFLGLACLFFSLKEYMFED
jgi:hypothetical protein